MTFVLLILVIALVGGGVILFKKNKKLTAKLNTPAPVVPLKVEPAPVVEEVKEPVTIPPHTVIIDNIYTPGYPDAKCPPGYEWCGAHTNCLKWNK